MLYKTGLNPSPAPPRLAFDAYVRPPLLPAIPATFGHRGLYPPRGWGYLKNAGPGAIGDCAVAGPMHVTMLWRRAIKQWIRFTNLDAQEDYFAITGGADVGADMVQVAKYWQKTGFRDARGHRHKIDAYMHIDPANFDYIDAACYLFGAVGLGIAVGAEEMRAFTQRRPWDDPNSPVDGYHYVPMVYKDFNSRTVITWGGEQEVSTDWCKAKVNEVVAILSDESLIAGKSLEGFDMAALQGDLQALKA